MSDAQALKLTVYLNESSRSGSELACDRLMALFERARVRTSILLRGIEGFGGHHRLHADRLETAALNPPLVAVAVDAPGRIEALVPQVFNLLPSGLVTTERAWFLGVEDPARSLPAVAHDAVRLTVYCGRGEQAAGTLVHRAITAHLRSAGVDGATAFLGVDGTVHGRRARARFFSRNADVPVMIVAVGGRAQVRRSLTSVHRLAGDPIVTMEGIRVCKRDGRLIAPPPTPPDGGGIARKLMVWAAGDTHAGGEALHYALVDRLRRSGASGATSLRGVWGYRGNGPAHGDSARSLRRSSPVVTVAIDRRGGDGDWRLVDELTATAGLVTSELVPAHRGIPV